MQDDPSLSHGDYRRAAAVALHHRRGDTTGVLAIVDECNQHRRGGQLLNAVLNLHATHITATRTDTGINTLATYVRELGEVEDPDTGIPAAARILDAHGRNDIDAINAELHGGDQWATKVFAAVLDLYTHTLPDISLDWLQAAANYMAGGEADGGA